jgi:hypothetical protein
MDRLGFRVEAEPLPVNPDDLGLSPQDREAVESFHILADYDQKLIIGLWQLNDLSGARLRSLSQNFLGRGVDCLFLATNADFNPLVFVSPRRIAGGKTKVLKLVVDRTHPTRHDLDVLQAISDHQDDIPSILNALREAFNVDRVTKRFYQEYAKAFRGLQKALTESNRGVREFQGNTDEDKAYLHAFAQRLMGRLMFLYFVQKKGWLNGDKRFLTGWYALARKGNYYRDVLEPLFFETLNTPEAGRTDRAQAFGDVPYLNGGLFERDYDFLLHLDNSVFDPDNEAGLLRFFNCYNFTVTEDTPLEVEVALDPEMLGKVFENLLEEEERGGTGTFYTPRVIVHGMCRDALAEYLQDAAQLGGGEVRQLLADPEGTTVERTTAKRIEDALSKLRCLDPAVGSGAFLVGMLQEMVALRHACFRARGAEARRGSDVVAEWKREYIQECLYGVDIKQEAVEIAKLRLWLSLVVDLERDQIEPLPNLDYKLMAGNSLIEVLDGQPILNPRVAQATLGMSETDTALQELHALKDRFFAAKPQQRGEIIQTIRDKEAQVIETHVREKLQAVEAEQNRIVQRKTLDKGKLTATNERRLKALYEMGGHFARLGQDVREGKPLPFFLYELHFCEVFGDKGGFDVVIANPPYVATQGVNQLVYRDELEAQYGYRRDLYVHFVDRTLGLTDNACKPLLRPGGVMAFITSSTYFSQEFFHEFRSGRRPRPGRCRRPRSG